MCQSAEIDYCLPSDNVTKCHLIDGSSVRERVELQLFLQGGVTKVSRYFRSVSVREVGNTAWKWKLMRVKVLMVNIFTTIRCHKRVTLVNVVCLRLRVGV